MKTVFVVYSQFPDDPSVVHGIFLTEQEAIECKEKVKLLKVEIGPDIYEIEVGVTLVPGICLQ